MQAWVDDHWAIVEAVTAIGLLAIAGGILGVIVAWLTADDNA
jgi:hypothetical protein